MSPSLSVHISDEAHGQPRISACGTKLRQVCDKSPGATFDHLVSTFCAISSGKVSIEWPARTRWSGCRSAGTARSDAACRPRPRTCRVRCRAGCPRRHSCRASRRPRRRTTPYAHRISLAMVLPPYSLPPRRSASLDKSQARPAPASDFVEHHPLARRTAWTAALEGTLIKDSSLREDLTRNRDRVRHHRCVAQGGPMSDNTRFAPFPSSRRRFLEAGP